MKTRIILENLQSNKNGVETLLVLYIRARTQNLCCVSHSIYCRVSGKRKLNKFIQDRKYISIKYQSFLVWEHGFLQRKFGQWNEFERLVVLFSTIILTSEVNFFISTGFLEVFYLPSVFIWIDALKRFFIWKVSVLNKCFQSWGIKSILKLYILLYGWQ